MSTISSLVCISITAFILTMFSFQMGLYLCMLCWLFWFWFFREWCFFLIFFTLIIGCKIILSPCGYFDVDAVVKINVNDKIYHNYVIILIFWLNLYLLILLLMREMQCFWIFQAVIYIYIHITLP